jgi:hypothetical protein
LYAITLELRFYRMVNSSRRRVTAVKIPDYNTRRAIFLLIVSLFFGVFAAGQATAADPRSSHAAAPSQVPARLIIRRNPNLGVNVIVRLWIDGQPAGPIGYGHTYKGFLTPGHHVLAVVASPRARWPVPLATACGCAKRPDLRLYSGHRWFRDFGFGRPVWLPATSSVISTSVNE